MRNTRTAACPPPGHRCSPATPTPAPATFGRGRKLSVYWGTGVEPTRVTIALPTSSSGDYWPDEQTSLIAETALLAQAPALRSVTTGTGVTFKRVEFTLPDRQTPTQAFWREHLDYLQSSGDIAAFGTRSDDRKLAVLTADGQSAAIIENVILLDRDDIMVRDCTPMRQEPVRGSSTPPGRVRYPDYPLRSDYLDLIETDDGRRVVDLLKLGEHVGATPPSIDATATWELCLAGRSDRLCIVLPVPQLDAADDEEEHFRAHWMVLATLPLRRGPVLARLLRLRTLLGRPAPPEHTVVRSGRRLCPSMRASSGPARTRSVSMSATSGRTPAVLHRIRPGGRGIRPGVGTLFVEPPAPWPAANERQGGYRLRDVAYHRRGSADGKKHLVKLAPELDPTQHDPLTLHVSENGLHMNDPVDGLKRLGVWLPTYAEGPAPTERDGLLPSELLTIEPLASLSGVDPWQWQPGRDCVIPFMDMQRSDLADHLLADFKWKASFEAFGAANPCCARSIWAWRWS